MTKDEVRKIVELSNNIDTFIKNEKIVKELLNKIVYFSDNYFVGISIMSTDSGTSDCFSSDIRMLSKEAKTRIAKAIEVEITSKLEELQKEFDSLKISRDE